MDLPRAKVRMENGLPWARRMVLGWVCCSCCRQGHDSKRQCWLREKQNLVENMHVATSSDPCAFRGVSLKNRAQSKVQVSVSAGDL